MDSEIVEVKKSKNFDAHNVIAIVDNKIVPPIDVVRYDEDDPYFVVAADKGTATFSDIANAISEHYKFWLGDDGLNMTSNLYFGLGKSYFCGHGCKVCFIHDELKAMKGKTHPIYNNDLETMSKTWYELYSFFDTIALDEDPLIYIAALAKV